MNGAENTQIDISRVVSESSINDTESVDEDFYVVGN